MTGEAHEVENNEASGPTADNEPDASKLIPQEQQKPQPEEQAAGSPGSEQEPEKPDDHQEQKPAADEEQEKELSPEEKVLAKMTAQPEPAEGRPAFIRDEDDPDNLLNPNEAERQLMGRRQQQRFDHLLHLLEVDRTKIAELEPMAELGRKVRESMGNEQELDAESLGLVNLAKLADEDPGQAIAKAQEWIDAIRAGNPDLAPAAPAAEESPTLFEGELSEDELEAIDLGLVSEDVIRRGRAVEQAKAKNDQAEKSAEKPAAKPAAKQEDEQPAEQEELPEPTPQDITTGQAIAYALMGADVEPSQVMQTYEQLLPYVAEVIRADEKRYPDPLNVPDRDKPLLAVQALKLFRKAQAEEAERKPKQPKEADQPMHRGGSGGGPVNAHPVAEKFGSEAMAVFEKLTSSKAS